MTGVQPMEIGIVAGEHSGDSIGADLMRALRASRPGLAIRAVAGARMQAEGCELLADVEALSVMGLAEILGSYPRLAGLRRRLGRAFIARPPAVFVGIDAPEFLLPLEARLRAAGIPVVHYVSPQVWAWREYRWRGIARSVDLMLTLFPFETRFYERHGIASRFVGHPLADRVVPVTDPRPARLALGLDPERPVLALLPGSRTMELVQHAGLFCEAAAGAQQALPGLQCVAAAANGAAAERLVAAGQAAGLALQVETGRVGECLAAADAVLTASGTATLETMLTGRPMVVAYRMRPLSHAILRRLVRVPWIAMPNLLAGEPLVPEFIQEAATPSALAAALLPWLDGSAERGPLLERFATLGGSLRRAAGQQAAAAVLELAADRGARP